PGGRRRRARRRRAHRLRGLLPHRALRRAAAAGGRGAGLRRRARPRAARRAVLRPRRAHRAQAAPAAAGAVDAAPAHRAARHPQPARGRAPRRPRDRARRPPRADRRVLPRRGRAPPLPRGPEPVRPALAHRRRPVVPGSTKGTAMTRPKVTMELLSLVFSLPQLVAKDEGYFDEEGVDVEFVTKEYARAGISPLEDHELLSSFGSTKSHFESGEASLYRACEWGQVRRSQDTTVGGRIVSKRAAVNSQAIMVRPDHPATHPQDLAGKPVAVNFHHGSHYVALQTLEGFLPREEIKVVHYGGPQARFEALRDGTVEAAALMEPWITLAE